MNGKGDWILLFALLTIRGSGTVTLVVGDDVATIISEDTYTAVGRSEIDTNSGSHGGCVMCGIRNWWMKVKGRESVGYL